MNCEPVEESSLTPREKECRTEEENLEINTCENGLDVLETLEIKTIDQDKPATPTHDSAETNPVHTDHETTSETKTTLDIVDKETIDVHEGDIHEGNDHEGDDHEGDDHVGDDHEGDDSEISSVSSGVSPEVPPEREEADGQESDRKNKKLDHDEDKRDPQYIPKKGNFYEHDDRTSEGEEPSTGKKLLTPKSFESKERWGHDMYDDNLQSPKSREELIEQYGYDIRLEEGPPKARRRRRYGRGPNKYTRRWEEEEAYTKSRGSWRGRGRGRSTRNIEDFPPLPGKEELTEAFDENKSNEKANLVKKEPLTHLEGKVEKKETSSVAQPVRKVKIDETSVHNCNASRGRGPARGRGRASQPFKSSGNFQRQSSSTAEEDIATLSKHFAEAVINVDNKSIPSKRASSVPPANSNEMNGVLKYQQLSEEVVLDKSSEGKSKRYSMQRQRSLPQATANGVAIVQPTAQPPPPRFIQPDQQFFQVGLDATPGAPANQYSNQTPGNYGPEIPVVTFVSPAAHQFQPLPTFLPPPAFLTPPPLATPPRGPEVYQGPTGITYYNTQSQVSRPVSTSRRVRLAIPIVAPPPESS